MPVGVKKLAQNAEEIRTTSTVEEIEQELPESYDLVLVRRYEPDLLEIRYGLTLPSQLIRRYAKLAAHRAETERLQDGSWYAEIPGFSGVWAQGDSEEEVIGELETVVRDWALLKIQDKDRNLPIIGLIDLNEL